MIEQLFDELKGLENVEAIALGGSRAGEHYDEKSDYDIYVYVNSPVDDDVRKAILQKYCSYMEIGNHYWEYEDNCQLSNGVDIDIIYRSLESFCREIADVVESFHAHNGYTTCMWYNLLTCRIVFDRNGELENAKKRFDVPYPPQLRENIIRQNLNLVSDAAPAYCLQIKKALARGDKVSVLHRTTAFLESYFDIIFAVNRLTHPGEKRLLSLCRERCEILPENFEENINELFDHLFENPDTVMSIIDRIISELKAIL